MLHDSVLYKFMIDIISDFIIDLSFDFELK